MPTAASGFQADETELVPDIQQYPHCAVGKMVFFPRSGAPLVGTGWIVGRRSFVTAAHCLFDRTTADFFDNITLTFGFEGTGTGASFSVVESAIHPFYKTRPGNERFRWDIGVGYVDQDLVKDFGSIGYDASGRIEDVNVEAVGYPANRRPLDPSLNNGFGDFERYDFNGQSMWYSLGDYLGMSADRHTMDNEMTGGCSGGPWLQNDVAVGLNSHRLKLHDNRMFSPVFDQDFLLLIDWLIYEGKFS